MIFEQIEYQLKKDKDTKKIYDITILFSKEFGTKAGEAIHKDLSKLGRGYVKLNYVPCPKSNEISTENSYTEKKGFDVEKPFKFEEVEQLVAK